MQLLTGEVRIWVEPSSEMFNLQRTSISANNSQFFSLHPKG
jgi:hypothetical protein